LIHNPRTLEQRGRLPQLAELDQRLAEEAECMRGDEVQPMGRGQLARNPPASARPIRPRRNATAARHALEAA